MNRRQLMLNGGLLATFLVGTSALSGLGDANSADGEVFEVNRTDAEWRAALGAERYAILRKRNTESPGSSPLNHEKRSGIFSCAGCNLPAYASDTKFDSGTGWPSFWASLPNAVATRKDNSMIFTRTEVHCRRCGGHFGHVFNDGPKPTGKRHCINGLALTFAPRAGQAAG